MLKRLETATALSFADLRVSHENRAVVVDGKTHVMLGRNALTRPEWPILREAAHGILAARQAGDEARAGQLAEGMRALVGTRGDLMAMSQLADLHARAARFR